MHRFYFARLGFCSPAGDAPEPTIGGATPPAPALVTPPAEPGVQVPTPETEKPGIGARAIAMFQGKGELINKITTLETQVTTITTERDDFKTQLTAALAERDGFKAELTKIETALGVEQSANKNVQTEVTHQLATIGVPPAQLPKPATAPAAVPADNASKIEALNDRIAAEKDPRVKGQLANEAWDLMKATKPSGNN